MSMLSIPETMMPDMKQIEAMNREFAAFLPFPGAANLMAHPAGGAAAMSALGFGMASHAFGLWMGSVASSLEAAQRLSGVVVPGADLFGFGASWNDADCDVDAATPHPKSPVSRAKSAARTVMADFERASAEIAGAAEKAAGVTAKANELAKAIAPFAEMAAPAGKELMPKDFRQPKSMEKPDAPDDLKLISGIGPKLEQVLNGLGVWTFAQIAAWSAEEIAWVDDYLAFAGRIERDEWLKQAGGLAKAAG